MARKCDAGLSGIVCQCGHVSSAHSARTGGGLGECGHRRCYGDRFSDQRCRRFEPGEIEEWRAKLAGGAVIDLGRWGRFVIDDGAPRWAAWARARLFKLVPEAEAGPRAVALPGAEAVRRTEIATPAMACPFSLTGGAVEAKGSQGGLF